MDEPWDYAIPFTSTSACIDQPGSGEGTSACNADAYPGIALGVAGQLAESCARSRCMKPAKNDEAGGCCEHAPLAVAIRWLADQRPSQSGLLCRGFAISRRVLQLTVQRNKRNWLRRAGESPDDLYPARRLLGYRPGELERIQLQQTGRHSISARQQIPGH